MKMQFILAVDIVGLALWITSLVFFLNHRKTPTSGYHVNPSLVASGLTFFVGSVFMLIGVAATWDLLTAPPYIGP